MKLSPSKRDWPIGLALYSFSVLPFSSCGAAGTFDDCTADAADNRIKAGDDHHLPAARGTEGKLGKAAPRLTGYLGTLIMPAFMAAAAASAHAPNWLRPLALSPIGSHTQQWSIKDLFELLHWFMSGIWQLRRSFSIEAQARQLVTGGPCLLARHPIYTGYLLQYFGILLSH